MESLGIDVGGSSVKLALIRDNQTIWQNQTPKYDKPSANELANTIRSTLGDRFPSGAAVGICVPGLRDAGSHIVRLSVNLPALNGLNLDDLVRDALGQSPARVEVLADTVASGYDIYAVNNLHGRLLSLALGTGVGAAVIDEGGIPLKVDGESPGHIGQFDVSIAGDDVIGPDGGFGSLEGYFGVPALEKRYGTAMPTILATLTADDAPLKALARAIRICHAIYCPDHVALTGGIGNRMSHLLTPLRKLVDKDLTSIARNPWTMRNGTDDFHAAKGAAKFAARSS